MRFSALTLAAATLLLPVLASAQDYGPRHEPSSVIRPAAYGWRNYVTVAEDPCGCTVPVRADCYDNTCNRCGIRPFCILHRFGRSLSCLFPCNMCRHGQGCVHGCCGATCCDTCGMSCGPCGSRFMASPNDGSCCMSCQPCGPICGKSCCQPSCCEPSCCEPSCSKSCEAPTCTTPVDTKVNPFQDDPVLTPLPAPTSHTKPLIPPVPVPSSEASLNPVLRPLARPTESARSVVVTRPSRAPVAPWKVTTASVTSSPKATEARTTEPRSADIRIPNPLKKLEPAARPANTADKIPANTPDRIPAKAAAEKPSDPANKEISVLRRVAHEVEFEEPKNVKFEVLSTPIIRLQPKLETLPDAGDPVNPLR